MNAGSREIVERGTEVPVDTHPRADLLKVGRFTAVSPLSSGYSGRGSTCRILMGAGLVAVLKPPNGVATLEAMD